MAGRPWENNPTPTLAEQRLDESLGLGRPRGNRRNDAEPEQLDVHGDSHAPEQELRGEYLLRRLVESPDEGGWRLFWRSSAQPPVIRVQDSVITGLLDLRAADLPYLLEFVRCRFEEVPDLRQTKLGGLVLKRCRFPGIRGRNLSTGNDISLLGCTSACGVVDLTDAQIDGSLELTDSVLHNPAGHAVHADRLQVSGALLAIGTRVSGQLRIPGAKIGGNLNLSGAALRNRGRHALNATGIQISGSLRAEVDPRFGNRFSAAGQLAMPSARVDGELRLCGALLEPGGTPPQQDESVHGDPFSTLILDRGEIRGDARLDRGFDSGGTIRMVSTSIAGDLRMSGARIDLGWTRQEADSVEQPPRAMHLDSAKVLGNLDAVEAVLYGQVRMVDVHVSGSFQLNRAVLDGPGTDVVLANRVWVGSNLNCRDADISGTLHLQGAHVGANLDLRSTCLTEPAWHPHRAVYKPSLDLRASFIGGDLVCATGRRAFSAEGEIQLRRATVARQTNFWGCLLGKDSTANANAVNAFGLSTQELTLLPTKAPHGRIRLRQAHCELLEDNDALWAATGGVDVEGFTYDNFAKPVKPTDRARVRQRLQWLRSISHGRYQPGPYDQLATVFRENGNEQHAATVLIEKQRRRYRAIAATLWRPLRLSVLLWSLLQRVTVNYGYQPVRALLWLLLFALAGTAWFAGHRLEPINAEDSPVWNPFLYTVDQLVPIINLGHDVMWRATGHSQWITVVLIAVGWILATTVAAGITRFLRRER
ncbi:hypothetical protein DFQ14_101466 [Halopolyspora algeriensis]|uniref:Membrane-associated oxidoreductase n=1 Tax=Halopolyspora algeriensis TaxID=1500506 RepID=A0A368W0G5_9ACTN|nr:oxidoreductase [Halopolyspora algeriensis]RCW47122.1 hypothetical protein DFQ14_101466 [Halopolyspora algeriensis]TQM48209.1 hypothetical protein FHU43_3171 [Halopolyspora algeriensis]